jgi:hypothetical protein
MVNNENITTFVNVFSDAVAEVFHYIDCQCDAKINDLA